MARTALILLALLCGVVRAGEDLAPVDVTVFYSKDDPQWAATEKAIDAAAAKYPRLRITKTALDSAEGYRQLLEVEKKLEINPTGDITLVMGPLFLTSRGERRDIEKHLEPLVHQVLHPHEKKGRIAIDVVDYAKQFFGKDAVVEQAPKTDQSEIVLNPVRSQGRLLGYVGDLWRDIRCPLCADTQFLMAVKLPELEVLDVRPVRFIEKISVKLDPKESAPFLNQFKGRTAKQTDVKVDAISGATKTSRSYAALVNEALLKLKALQAPE